MPVASPPLADAILVGYAGALGVGIDFDHFLIARWNTGDWTAVRRVLARPSIVFVDQDAIFDENDLFALQRLLSHVVIGGLLVGALAVVLPSLALVSAVVLYAHVLADLVDDNRRHEAYVARLAGYYRDQKADD